MKKTLFILIAGTILLGCGNSKQDSAIEQAKQTQDIMKDLTPGTVKTAEGGYMMTATINGKAWSATSMLPPEAPARIIGYNNNESISLPYDRRDMVVGSKTDFKNSAVDIFMNDEVGLWGGHAGEMEVTKVDDKSAEGRFHVTAVDEATNKKIEITDGFFRILF
jgi:hypothetical protein